MDFRASELKYERCVIFDATRFHFCPSGQHWFSKDTAKFNLQHVPKSTALTKLTEPKWGVKTPPHIQDKCDFTLIYWWVVKHDIPLEMNLYCVHRGHIFPVGNKTLHILKGGYGVDTL